MNQQFHSWVYVFKKNTNTNLKRYVHPYIYNNIIHSYQDMEAT